MTKKRHGKRLWQLVCLLCLVSGSFWAFSLAGVSKPLVLGQMHIDLGRDNLTQNLRSELEKKLLAQAALQFDPAKTDAKGWSLHVSLVDQGRQALGWARQWGDALGLDDVWATSKHAIAVRLEHLESPQAPFFTATVPLPAAPTSSEALKRGVRQGLDVVRSQRELVHASLESLLLWLDESHAKKWGRKHRIRSSSWDMQAFVIDELGRRRDPRAGAPLVALLEAATHERATDAQKLLALRAVGALVKLKERRAVLPMIALAQNQSPAYVSQMAFALAALGGRVAEGYLFTLASGHEHDSVRDAASQALKELRGTWR